MEPITVLYLAAPAVLLLAAVRCLYLDRGWRRNVLALILGLLVGALLLWLGGGWVLSRFGLASLLLGAALVLAVLAAAVIVELVTPTALVSIWFAAGALAAVIFTILHASFWLQIAVFVLVSLLLLALVRPAATRYLRGNVVATNADRYIGAIAVVEQTITTAQWGIVKVEGSSWSAASYEGERIEKGSRVKIVAIEGAKLLVAKIEE